MVWYEVVIAAIVGVIALGWILFFVNYVFNLMVYGPRRVRR